MDDPRAIARGLRPSHARILRLMARWNEDVDGCLTAREIGEALHIKTAHGQLNAMAYTGLVSKLGVGPNNARTWTVLPLGRAVAAALAGKMGAVKPTNVTRLRRTE